MTVPKNKATVKNKYHEKRVKRFYAICKSLNLNGQGMASSYKSQMGVSHIADFTDKQWEFIFADLSSHIEDKARNEGAIFTDDLAKTLEELFKD